MAGGRLEAMAAMETAELGRQGRCDGGARGEGHGGGEKGEAAVGNE